MFPKVINICGFDYDLIFPYDFKSSDRLGLCDNGNRKIYLTDRHKGSNLSEQYIHESLLHEVFHAFEYLYYPDDINHYIIEKMSTMWYQFILDNKFISNDIVPKQVKIGPFIWNVIDMEEEMLNIDSEDWTFYIDYANNNFLFNHLTRPDKKKSKYLHLMRAISCAMLFYIISPNDENDDDEVSEIDVVAMTTGMYQFLRSNSWYIDLIKVKYKSLLGGKKVKTE